MGFLGALGSLGFFCFLGLFLGSTIWGNVGTGSSPLLPPSTAWSMLRRRCRAWKESAGMERSSTPFRDRPCLMFVCTARMAALAELNSCVATCIWTDAFCWTAVSDWASCKASASISLR